MGRGPVDLSRDDPGDSPEAIRARMVETRAELEHHIEALKDRLLGDAGPSQRGAEKAMPSKQTGSRSTSGKAASKRATPRASAAKTGGESPEKPRAATKASASARKGGASGASKGAKAAGSPDRPAAKAKRSKAGGSAKSSRSRKGVGQKLVAAVGEKTVEVLGEVLAGAAVGAVTAAAAKVRDEPTAAGEVVAARGPAAKGGAKGGRANKASDGREILGKLASGAAVGAVAGAAKAVIPPVEEAKEAVNRGVAKAEGAAKRAAAPKRSSSSKKK